MDIKNEKIYFWGTLFICTALTAVFFFVFVVSSVRNWVESKRRLSQRQTELALRYETAEENKRLSREIAEIGNTYGDFNAMFFSLDDMSAQAVKELARITQDLQMQVSALVPGEPKKIETLSAGIGFDVWEAVITLKIKTTYGKLLDFLRRIEGSTKFIRIKEFRISKGSENILLRDADLTVGIYSLQKKELPKK